MKVRIHLLHPSITKVQTHGLLYVSDRRILAIEVQKRDNGTQIQGSSFAVPYLYKVSLNSSFYISMICLNIRSCNSRTIPQIRSLGNQVSRHIHLADASFAAHLVYNAISGQVNELYIEISNRSTLVASRQTAALRMNIIQFLISSNTVGCTQIVIKLMLIWRLTLFRYGLFQIPVCMRTLIQSILLCGCVKSCNIGIDRQLRCQ